LKGYQTSQKRGKGKDLGDVLQIRLDETLASVPLAKGRRELGVADDVSANYVVKSGKRELWTVGRTTDRPCLLFREGKMGEEESRRQK